MADRWTEHLTGHVAAATKSIRWTPGRKAALLELIRRGDFTEAQACERYGLSLEELAIWRAGHAARGQRGLAVTRIQERRHG